MIIEGISVYLRAMQQVLVIPDVHGRKFWKDAVGQYPELDTIFLGDYHDPYSAEGISRAESLQNLKELLAYTNEHPNCQLLLGNHDLHYLCSFGEDCRYDYENEFEIRNLLLDNIGRMSVATKRSINGNCVVFTHAPILKEWVEQAGINDKIKELIAMLNDAVKSLPTDPHEIEQLLGYISPYRGGNCAYGSPVWADIREINGSNLIDTADYFVFGHTQMTASVINARWACLDCRHAFIIDDQLNVDQLILK